MTQCSWLDTDLLRNRRDVLGTQRQKLVPTKILLRAGLRLGFVPLILLIVLSAGLSIFQNKQQEYYSKLVPFHDSYQKTLGLISSLQKKIDTVDKYNKTILDSISSVSSSSALLTDVSRRTPANIKITKLSTTPGRVDLEGISYRDSALQSLNAFLLLLDLSPFVVKGSPSLDNVEKSREPSQPSPVASGASTASTRRNTYISFKLHFLTTESHPSAYTSILKSLDAGGLAKRIAIANKLLEQSK